MRISSRRGSGADLKVDFESLPKEKAGCKWQVLGISWNLVIFAMRMKVAMDGWVGMMVVVCFFKHLL